MHARSQAASSEFTRSLGDRNSQVPLVDIIKRVQGAGCSDSPERERKLQPHGLSAATLGVQQRRREAEGCPRSLNQIACKPRRMRLQKKIHALDENPDDEKSEEADASKMRDIVAAAGSTTKALAKALKEEEHLKAKLRRPKGIRSLWRCSRAVTVLRNIGSRRAICVDTLRGEILKLINTSNELSCRCSALLSCRQTLTAPSSETQRSDTMSDADRAAMFSGMEYKDIAALVAGMRGEELAKFFAILNDTDRAALLRGMSDEETAIFLANMGAEERTRFQTAMRHAADRADASDRASNFITASRGMQMLGTHRRLRIQRPASLVVSPFCSPRSANRVAKATPRHKHSGRRRRVGTGKSPAAILRQSPVRYLGDKCCEERQDLSPQMVCEVHERYLPGVGRAYIADLKGQKKLLGRVEHLRSGRNVIVSTGSLCVTPKWFANYQSRY